jgi:hypothetical protein
MKKGFLLLALSTLTIFTRVNSQTTPTLNWAQTIGSIDTEDAFEIVADENGDVIVCGRYQGTTDFDPGPGTTSLTSPTQCAYIAKYTSTGEFVWVVDFPSSFASYLGELKLDTIGNVYACGVFYEDVDLQFGPGTNLLTTTNYEAFMVKLNSSGALEYTYHTPVTTGSASFLQLAVNSIGEVFLIADQYGSVDYDPGAGTILIDNTTSGADFYLVKLSNMGSVTWVKDLEPEVYDMEFDASDNLWIEGPFDYAIIDVAPGTPVTYLSGFYADNFVVKLNSDGTYLDDFMYIHNIVIDALTQDVLISGHFGGEANFEPATSDHILNSAVTEELFVARYSNAGVCKWAKRVESNVSSYSIIDNDLRTDHAGNIYIAGTVGGIYDVDPGSGTTYINSSNADSYIMKWDSSGNFKWCYEIIDGGELNNIALTPDGNYLYLTGSFEFDSDIDPDGTTEITSAGNMDAFIVKWNNCDLDVTIFNNGTALEAAEQSAGTTYQWFNLAGDPISGANSATYKPTENGGYQVLITKGSCSYFSSMYSVTNAGLQSVKNETNIIVFPNPAENYVVVSGVTETATLTIFDLLGNSVHRSVLQEGSSQISIDQLPAGSYILQVQQGNSISNLHLVKK